MQHGLWEFATALYAQEGVAERCLQAQDAHGADVCLLLAGLWLERRGSRPEAQRVVALRRLADAWQGQVTAPLRHLRRAWKAPAQQDAGLAALRQRLAALELDAERLLLERLEQTAADWPPGEAAATWLERLCVEQPPAALLASLRAAAAAQD